MIVLFIFLNVLLVLREDNLVFYIIFVFSRYTIVSGDKTRDFTIGEHSGVLSVNRKLEFERKNAYQLTIQVGNKLIRKICR